MEKVNQDIVNSFKTEMKKIFGHGWQVKLAIRNNTSRQNVRNILVSGNISHPIWQDAIKWRDEEKENKSKLLRI